MSIIEKAAERIGHDKGSISRRSAKVVAAVESDRGAKSSTISYQQAPGVRASGSAVRDPQGAQRTCQEIDLARLERMGILTPNTDRTRVAEEFRMIKRPLIARTLSPSTPGIRSNLILVTSSLPGEGKTFCAISLAMSIAMEMEKTVLLVDCNVARPSALSILGLQADLGLLDLLRNDELKLSDVLIKTSVPKLSVLAPGGTQRNASELLASQRMQRLLDEISARYLDRIVVFDSPELSQTSEAQILAEQMGQIVVVVEATRTAQSTLQSVLQSLNIKATVNLLFNKTRF